MVDKKRSEAFIDIIRFAIQTVTNLLVIDKMDLAHLVVDRREFQLEPIPQNMVIARK